MSSSREREGAFLASVHDLDWQQLRDRLNKARLNSEPDLKISDGRLPSGKRILVIGCGTGQDVAFLAEMNDVNAIDVSPEAIELAKQFGIRAVLANVSDGLPFPDEFFDIIVCKDVLEHMLDPAAVMREIHRTLKQEGYAVINVPNHFYFTLRWKLLLGRGLRWKTWHHDHTHHFEEWNYMHIRFFTYAGFCRFLRSCAFPHIHFFWDLGPLLHYSDPDRLIPRARRKLVEGGFAARRSRLAVRVLLPLLSVFNIICPRAFRARVAALCPGLLSACFYVHCRKG